ncbi:MAG: DUF1559 domain-containing protein [Gemmataceae bacterium]|nr:DUF1559 domain-containing protein [Gemmataceae bacterium]
MTNVHFAPCPGFHRRLVRSALVALAAMALASPSLAAESKLPPDLDLVPREAVGFVHFRAADVWKSELMTDVRRLVDRAGKKAIDTFLRRFAPDPSTIDRVTIVLVNPRDIDYPFPPAGPEAVSALVIVTTNKPYDRLQVTQALGQREKVYRRNVYHFNEDLWSGLALVDRHNFVIGSEDSLIRWFDMTRTRKDNGALQNALETAAGKHPVTLGLNMQALAKEKQIEFLPPPVQKLFQAQAAVFTFDVAKEVRLNVRLDYANEDQAKDGQKALRETLDVFCGALGQAIPMLEKSLENEGDGNPAGELTENFAKLVGLGLMRDVDGLLKDATIQRDKTLVQLPLTYKGLEANNAAVLFMMGISTIGTRSNVTFARVGAALGVDNVNPYEAHLKKLAEGLEKYHKDKGSYPPPAIYDGDGRPVLSWRVALLPYLGQDELYKEFRLNEPWDSLHNKKLLKKLPAVYQSVGGDGGQYKTANLLFTGEGTIFVGKTGTKKTDVAPGTILVVDAGDATVYWSKPADLAYADDQPIKRFFGKHGFGSLQALTIDGKLRAIEQNIDEKELRALIKKATKPKSDQ